MRVVNIILILLLLFSLFIIPNVSATTNCSSGGPTVANVCEGISMLGTTTGGVSSGRCFFWRTINTAPACTTGGIGTTSNEAGWQIDAGNCVTLYYFDVANGALPPATPNKVTLQVFFDGTGTIIKTFQTLGAEPANSASNSFCATNTGNNGDSPRAGTYHINLRAVKDNGQGGVGNYDINTGTHAAPCTGIPASCDQGAIRARLIVSSITRSAYPADSVFAYGTAADETVTITSTFTAQNGDANVELGNNGLADAGSLAVYEQGATTDLDTTTLAQSFVVDNTYPSASTSIIPFFSIGGNSVLTGLTWTNFATTGHGSCIIVDSVTVVHCSTTFNIDPRIIFDSDGIGTFATADDIAVIKLGSSSGAIVSKFNQGETFYAEWYVFNARGEKLTRTMTFAREDASATNCGSGSFTPTAGGLYTATVALPTSGTCTVTNIDPGSPRYFRVTNTMQDHRSLQVFTISSLYYIDAHIQLSSTLNKDNFPTQNANEDTAYIISTAQTDTTHGWCHVVSIRKDLDIDTSGSVIVRSYIDPTTTNRFSQNTDTATDGWTPTSLDLLASTPLGTWNFECKILSTATFNGNYGIDDQPFTVSVPSIPVVFPGDPLRILCSPIIANPGESLDCVASENNIDGSIRSGNAAHTFFDLYTPSHTALVTGAAATEIGTSGQYYYNRAWGANPVLGSYIIVVRTDDSSVIASSTEVYVETDPTLTLATSTQISNSQTTITNAIEHIDNSIDNVQTTQNNTLTNIEHLDLTLDNVQSTQNNTLVNIEHLDSTLDNVQSTQNNTLVNIEHLDSTLDNVQSTQNITLVNQASATQVSNIQNVVNHLDDTLDNVQSTQNATLLIITIYQNNLTAFLGHIDNQLHNNADLINATQLLITNFHNNLTAYLDHIDSDTDQIINGISGINMTVNATINQTVNNHLSFSPYLLLMAAIVFFAIAAELRNDLLYWIMCFILSVLLLFVRPITSIVPPEFFVGWLFIVLYQAYVTLKNNRGILTPGDE